MACSTGRGKKYKKRTKTNYSRVNKNRPWALIKTPVGEEVCVDGGSERRRQRERNCGRGKVRERKQTPAGGRTNRNRWSVNKDGNGRPERCS